MPKTKLYLIAGLTLIVVAGSFIYMNSIKKTREDAVNNLTEAEDQGETSPLTDGTSLPAGFPSDFPIYPEAQLESAYESKGEDVKATSVVWLVSASLENVSEFYMSELIKSGRKISSTLEDENSTIISFEKEKEKGFIGIGRKEGNIVISVSFGTSFKEPTI